METVSSRQRVQKPSCEEIEQSAKALLESTSHFVGRAHLFDFRCSDDVLIVRGCVPTYYLKQILQTVLKNVDGVRLVDNQVMVDMSAGIVGPAGGRGPC